VVPGAVGSVHNPTLSPACLVQMPVQHSKSVMHASPICVQYDGCPEHRPFTQNLEQQLALSVHSLPTVLQPGLSAMQTEAPPSTAWPHLPLQHVSPLVQAWLSEVQMPDAHTPPLQRMEQHSGPPVHASPGCLHTPGWLVQLWVAGSQFAEQHSACWEQLDPSIRQCVLTSIFASPEPPAVPAFPAFPPVDTSPPSPVSTGG